MTDETAGRWPNFFVIGAAKAGTTSLHRYLDQHPEVFMSKPKETYFFNRVWDEVGDDPEALEDAAEDYRALFADAGGEQVLGEATPGYLAHPDVPERIARTVPEARFLASLRDPVERAHSSYLMEVREDRFEGSFREAIDAELDAGPEAPPGGIVAPGLYHTHLARWFDVHGRDAVQVICLDELEDDPRGTVRKILGFLDVDPAAAGAIDVETRHNPHRVPRNAVADWLRTDDRVIAVARTLLPRPVRIWLGERVLTERPTKPEIDPDARDRLVDLYAPEVDRLEDLLGRDLPQLRRTWEG